LFFATMSLPLTIRKNIRDSEPKLKEHLEKLREITGKDFEFEADWAGVVAQLDEHTKNNIGNLYHNEIIGYLVQNIDKICKDEMTKESLVEATSANKIIFRCNDKIKNYWNISFENGAIVVEHKKNICNTYDVCNFNIVAIMPTPGLPLAVRLNLEKHRPQLEEYLQQINELTGASDWSLEVDFDKILPQIANEYTRNNIGDTYYREIMGYIVQNLQKTLASETTKESFLEATNQHKITIAINDKQPSYWKFNFNNGVLELTHKKDICNTYDVVNFDLAEIIPSPGLPLKVRLDIEKYKPDLDENLERINQATGETDWSFEADFEKLLPVLDEYARKNIGSTYYKECMKYVADNIEKVCKNESVKEAFNEATSQHKIIFQVDANPKSKMNEYWNIKFENGTIVVTHKPQICNTYDLSNKPLVDLIPSPGLPLVTRLNIDKNRENLEEHLEKIRSVTGESDWSVEIDWEKIVKANPAYQRNIGDTYYNEIMKYLAQNLEKTLKSETTKEAFLEATNQRKIVITFTENPKENQYWKMFFENGALIIQHKKDICNTYDVCNFKLESVMPVPGLISLMARLNIEKNQDNLREHLERLKEATGEEYSLDDSCLENVYKAITNEYTKNNIGDTFLNEAMKYLSENFANRCKDDMFKEAINETVTNRQIIFVPDAKAKTYWDIKFQNGNVVVTFKPDLANLYDIRNFDLEKLL